MSTATATASYDATRAARMLELDPPLPGRKRSAPRRKPQPGRQYVPAGDRPYRRSQRVKVGSIIFPDPSEGWSDLCIRLVEMACDFVLELEGDYPVREWGGLVPDVFRSDLMTVASNLADDEPERPTSEIMAALAEALHWLGYDD